jgi:hypothetical protein
MMNARTDTPACSATASGRETLRSGEAAAARQRAAERRRVMTACAPVQRERGGLQHRRACQHAPGGACVGAREALRVRVRRRLRGTRAISAPLLREE